jgi:hypothetical protein
MTPHTKLIFTSVLIMCASFVLVASIDIGAGYMRVRSQYATDVARLPTSPNRTSITFLTITAVDPITQTILARVRSQTTAGDLDMRLHIDPNFVVARQDPIIENAVVIGTHPVEPATLSEVKFGSHGIGVISTDEGGRSTISYLLIGDPFPRP